MGLQCQLNLMSCLILMLVHFDKTPSWQKKTHSLRSNPVFLFGFFFFFSCAYLSSSSQHTVTLSAPPPPPKRSLPLSLSRRLQSGRDHFDRRRPRRPIFLSCYEEKPFPGVKNWKPVWPQSAKQRAHLEGGFANPRTNAHLRARAHTLRGTCNQVVLSPPPSCEAVTLHHGSERHLGLLYITNSNTRTSTQKKKKKKKHGHTHSDNCLFSCAPVE